MGKEVQQPPESSDQGSLSQQGYYGWQYDQDETEVRPPSASQHHPHSLAPPQMKPPTDNLPPGRAIRQPNVPPQQQQKYQQPIQDMGSTLGFSQTTQYQYFEVPQPSQPIPQLRQERLQQLREERMRRQQRRMRGGDATAFLPWNKGNKASGSGLPLSPVASSSKDLTPPLPLPGVAPVRTPTQRPEGLEPLAPQQSAAAGATPAQPASTPAQDTGMIQKVRVGRATAILTISFVASRVLGLMRSSMFAYVLGAGHTSDAYYQAFLIPDFIFNIVSGGALSSAFIPVFTNAMVGENDAKKAWHIASSALNLALTMMVILAGLFIIFAHQLVPLINIGITNPQELNLITSLTQIMLLQSVALGGGVIVTAVLNAKQDFKLPAIGTVLYNVGLIAGLLPGLYMLVTGHHDDNLAVLGATWGVVIGAVLQIGIQIPGLFKIRMQYSPRAFDWRNPGIIQIARQMVPRILNSGMVYLSTYVDRTLILTIVDPVGGGVTLYNQAFQLVLLPYGIFGLSASSAAFPTLAENVARGRFDRVRNTILETLRSILFLSIPSSVALIILGLPVVQLLLQHGAFILDYSQVVAITLAFYAIGLPGLAAVEILVRSFYAMRDTKTPVIVSIAQFVLKIALSVSIIDVAAFGTSWGLAALAFSTSVSNLIEACVLFWLLHQRIGDLRIKELLSFIGRVLLAATVMGVGVLVVRVILDMVLSTTHAESLGLSGVLMVMVKLLIEAFVGIFIYVRFSRRMKIDELSSLKRILDRLKLSWI